MSNFFILVILFSNNIVFSQIKFLNNDSFLLLKKCTLLEDMPFDINLNLKFSNGYYKVIRNGNIMEGKIADFKKVDTWKMYNKKADLNITEIHNNDSIVKYYILNSYKHKTTVFKNKNEKYLRYLNNSLIYYEFFIDSLNLSIIKEFYLNHRIKKSYNVFNNSKYGNYIEYYSNGIKKYEACYCNLNNTTEDNFSLSNSSLCIDNLCIFQSIASTINVPNNKTNYAYKAVIFNTWDKYGNPIVEWFRLGENIIKKKYNKGKLSNENIFKVFPNSTSLVHVK